MGRFTPRVHTDIFNLEAIRLLDDLLIRFKDRLQCVPESLGLCVDCSREQWALWLVEDFREAGEVVKDCR